MVYGQWGKGRQWGIEWDELKLSHGSMRRWEWGEYLLWLWSEGIGESGEDGVVVAGVVGYFCADEGWEGVGGVGGGKFDFGYCEACQAACKFVDFPCMVVEWDVVACFFYCVVRYIAAVNHLPSVGYRDFVFPFSAAAAFVPAFYCQKCPGVNDTQPYGRVGGCRQVCLDDVTAVCRH